ncbi:MAG: SBBP repeat-containing protein [Acidobacteriia bacterium]|nr:SBBP repeat-containing protein [Terriglobia bacterium]
MFRLSRLALFVCTVFPVCAAAPEAALARAKAALARLPLRFEVNQGQFPPTVRYAARAGGYSLFLEGRGPSLSLAGSERVNISLLDSNPAPRIEPLDPLAARTNYFVGSRADWHTGIANYERVRYHAVYPGIDLVYYGNQSQLEYDFVLTPGADANAIRMKFRGPGRLRITPEGDLALETKARRIIQKRPVIYQQDPGGTRREIAGRYTLVARNVVGIRLDGYDRARPLVIDPVITYATYMGGSGKDQITAVKWAPNGLLYIAGGTTTSDLVAAGNAFKTASAGLTDAFVAIVDTNAAGNFGFVYLSYLGGANVDVALAMDVDAAGFIYLTGTTNSTDFPIVGAAVQATGAATTVDAFVSKIDPNAAGSDGLVYSTFLGGTTGNESGNGIAVGADGMIYVIGTTNSSDFPVSSGAYAAVKFGDPPDAFLTKIDPTSSTPVYSTYMGGEGFDDGRSIAVAPSGLVYFSASTFSTLFPLAGLANSPVPLGAGDIIVGVMDMTKPGVASLVYSTYFGGSANDVVRKIALDAKGNLMLTGYTLSPDFPVTPDAVQGLYGGNGDAFVSVLNPLDPVHFLVYSTFLGGSESDVAYDITHDSAGAIYVTGYTLSPDFPVTKDGPQPLWGGGIDVFVTKLKAGVAGPAGLQYSTYIGATPISVGTALAVGSDGTAFVGGYTSGGLPITGNATQGGFAGGASDGFIVAIGGTTVPPTTATLTGTEPLVPQARGLRPRIRKK